MFREGVAQQRVERVLIASSDNDGRRRIGEVAKAAGLRAVGFIRESSQVDSRVRLSQPEVLLLDDEMLRQLQAERRPADAQAALQTQKLVLIGRAVAYDSAQLKRLGLSAAIELGGGDPQHLEECGRLLRKVLSERTETGAAAIPAAAGAGQGAAGPGAAGPGAAGQVAGQGAAGHAVAAGRKILPPCCVVVGASTGGPVALMTFLKALPESFHLPLALVQHMPPTFTRMLADRLNAECAVRVVEAEAGMPFIAGTVYIAPGGMHMTIEGTAGDPCIGLNLGPLENSCRPAVDVLFRSSARIYGGRQLAIVLTGMGHDGLAGARELYALGSRVVVQDAATSTVWGMPGAIAQAGYADDILSISKIAPHLVRCV